ELDQEQVRGVVGLRRELGRRRRVGRLVGLREALHERDRARREERGGEARALDVVAPDRDQARIVPAARAEEPDAARVVEGELRRDQHDLLVRLGDEERVEVEDRRQRRAAGGGHRARLLEQLRALRGREAARLALELLALGEGGLLGRAEEGVAAQAAGRIRR